MLRRNGAEQETVESVLTEGKKSKVGMVKQVGLSLE